MYIFSVPKEVLNSMETITCSKCKSVIGYNATDIITDYDYEDFTTIMKSMLGEVQIIPKYVIKCPVCGEYIELCE